MNNLGNNEHFESNECEILVCVQKLLILLGMFKKKAIVYQY